MYQKRRMTSDDVISPCGCLLSFLAALILFLPITSLLVIITRVGITNLVCFADYRLCRLWQLEEYLYIA